MYAITGCVSVLFCLVIVSGAIRAIRHPERYGPRSAGRHDPGMPQTRAQGLTRAILDTFPLVKFGSSTAPNNSDPEAGTTKNFTGTDSQPDSPVRTDLEMKNLGQGDDPNPIATEPRNSAAVIHFDIAHKDSEDEGETAHSAISIDPPPRPRPPKGAGENAMTVDGNEVMPASIGRETCPICIVDFEEGDDLRQLPCEGKHRFHQQCVDPWLLELSSSCPICRHDFLALETMLSSDTDSDEGTSPVTPSRPNSQSRANRFSRYIRRAIRRRQERDELDPTDPYMPQAASTSL